MSHTGRRREASGRERIPTIPHVNICIHYYFLLLGRVGIVDRGSEYICTGGRELTVRPRPGHSLRSLNEVLAGFHQRMRWVVGSTVTFLASLTPPFWGRVSSAATREQARSGGSAGVSALRQVRQFAHLAQRPPRFCRARGVKPLTAHPRPIETAPASDGQPIPVPGGSLPAGGGLR